MTSFEKRLVALTMMSHALAHFFEQAFPPIISLIDKEYHLGLAAAGGIGNVFPFFFGLGALPAGVIVDKFGSRRTMFVFLIASASAGLFMLLVRPLWGVATLMLVLGLSAGLYHPAGVTLISNNMRKVGAGLGLHGVGGNLGLALGPMFAAAVATAFGWRAAYAALAVPALIIAFWYWRDPAFKNDGKPNVSMKSADEPRAKSDAIRIPIAPKVILWVPLCLLFLLQILNGFCYRGMLTFFPTFFSGSFSSSSAESSVLAGGVITTAVLIIGVIGQYLGGLASDRWRGDWIYAISFTAATPMLLILGYLLGWSAVICAGAFAFLYFASQPVGNKILVHLTPPAFRGRAYGISFFANFGIGSFSASVSGWIGQNYGVKYIFPFLGMVLVGVSAIGWLMVLNLRKNNDLFTP